MPAEDSTASQIPLSYVIPSYSPLSPSLIDSTQVNRALNEFYLNSHVAIQGTSKPCKYSLIYDEIGFKVI